MGDNSKVAIANLNVNLHMFELAYVMDKWTACVEQLTKETKFIIICVYFQYHHEIQPYLYKLEKDIKRIQIIKLSCQCEISALAQ